MTNTNPKRIAQMHTPALLDRMSVTIAELKKPEVQAVIEPEFAERLSAEKMGTVQTNLKTAYDEFSASTEQSKREVTRLRRENTATAAADRRTMNAQIAKERTAVLGEIAELQRQIRERRKTMNEKSAALRSAFIANHAKQNQECEKAIAALTETGAKRTDAFVKAYQTATEEYRAAEGIFIANCNEASKMALVKQVFAPTVRAKKSTKTAAKTAATA